MIKNPTNKELQRLEDASMKDKNYLSNMGVSTHYIKGIGTFYYRLVCEFVKEELTTKIKGEKDER